MNVIIEEKLYLKKIRKYIIDAQNRKWLGPLKANPYSGESEKAVIYVLEGTPIRGFVVFNYGVNKIWAYDSNGKRVKSFSLITDYYKDL